MSILRRKTPRGRRRFLAFLRAMVYTDGMKNDPALPCNVPALTAEHAAALLAEDTPVCNAQLTGALPLRCTGAEFSRVRFTACDLSAAVLKGADFADCVFERCDLSGGCFAEAAFRRVRFCECKGVGADFSECAASDTAWEGGNFTYAAFSEAKLRGVRLTECDFSQADMDGCLLKNFTADKVRFARTNFFNTALKGVDLSSCALDGALFSAQLKELRGAVLSPLQCVALVRALGVNVKN